MSSNNSSIKKTIQINPALFNLSKTRKNHHSGSKGGSGEKKAAPLISPNQLKTQLLRRIKEHKHRENREKDNDSKGGGKGVNVNANTNINTNTSSNQDIAAYTDEFEESLNYLKSLSNQKEEIQKKTLKNYPSLFSSPYSGSSSSYNNTKNYVLPSVDLELPESLKEVVPSFQPINPNPFRLNYSVDNVVPYGVLKGGMKPTYRSFLKTQKNYGSLTGGSSAVVPATTHIIADANPTTTPIINTPTVDRLERLKEKIRNKQEDLQQQREVDDIIMSQNLIQKPAPIVNLSFVPSSTGDNFFIDENVPIIPNQNINTNYPQIPTNTKRFLKRTIRRKYTLGKSQLKKTVGVLLKDRNTRKKVLTAHKDLKRTTIHDVKKYLRDHNLIKTGSNTPNDVIRKIYETAMLAGDITNHNNEVLLHNLSR
jgi:hypothetical protein